MQLGQAGRPASSTQQNPRASSPVRNAGQAAMQRAAAQVRNGSGTEPAPAHPQADPPSAPIAGPQPWQRVAQGPASAASAALPPQPAPRLPFGRSPSPGLPATFNRQRKPSMFFAILNREIGRGGNDITRAFLRNVFDFNNDIEGNQARFVARLAELESAITARVIAFDFNKDSFRDLLFSTRSFVELLAAFYDQYNDAMRFSPDAADRNPLIDAIEREIEEKIEDITTIIVDRLFDRAVERGDQSVATPSSVIVRYFEQIIEIYCIPDDEAETVRSMIKDRGFEYEDFMRAALDPGVQPQDHLGEDIDREILKDNLQQLVIYAFSHVIARSITSLYQVRASLSFIDSEETPSPSSGPASPSSHAPAEASPSPVTAELAAEPALPAGPLPEITPETLDDVELPSFINLRDEADESADPSPEAKRRRFR